MRNRVPKRACAGTHVPPPGFHVTTLELVSLLTHGATSLHLYGCRVYCCVNVHSACNQHLANLISRWTSRWAQFSGSDKGEECGQRPPGWVPASAVAGCVHSYLDRYSEKVAPVHASLHSPGECCFPHILGNTAHYQSSDLCHPN